MADKTKEKKKEPKMILEREYIVPLRREWLKVAKHKRANRAVKELKIFIVRHMKIYDRDLRKVKIDNLLNNEIRFRGMRKPPAKIKVKAKKYDDNIVKVELVNIPEHIKYIRLREEKTEKEVKKKIEEKKPEEAKQEDKEMKKEEEKKKEESKEKEESSKEAELELAKEQAKEQKHTIKQKGSATQDMGYKRASRGR